MKYKINIEVDGGPDDRPLNEIRVQFVKDKSVTKTEIIKIDSDDSKVEDKIVKSPKGVTNKSVTKNAEVPAEMKMEF